MAKTKKVEIEDISVEQKLKALHNLQQIDTQIDKIKIVRGELPLEVEDLEDEIAGLQTRIDNFKQDVENLKATMSEKEDKIKGCQTMIKKYEEQQMNVRNNREYDSLTKEIEFQKLEIQLAEKMTNTESQIVAFGTEAPYYNAMGMETIILGPGDIAQAHQPNEYLDINRIQPAIDLLKQLIKRFCL